ncbi:MAG: helix-turn-helix transcriptional regulator [Firmicutes bacterium]|nr:helix-turn-helix transcriptional regulator [Bacillota bacterium]
MPTEKMESISKRLKAIRLDYGLSQVDFAKRIGITNAYVSKIEKGKTIPSEALIRLICKEFKINELWLKNGESPVYLGGEVNRPWPGVDEANKKLGNIERHLLVIINLLRDKKPRRRSGKHISKITLLGLEKDVEKLISEGKTYREIADCIYKKTGKKVSKASIGRFFQAKKR